MAKPPHPKLLLVEGAEELRFLSELLEAELGVPWKQDDGSTLIDIEHVDGVEKLLKPGLIGAELKSPRRHSVGILVDADSDPAHRWRQLTDRCAILFPDFPAAPVPDGLVLAPPPNGQVTARLGVWMMPNNAGPGMLETFVAALRPTDDTLLTHARDACAAARQLAAPFKQAHHDKAVIHTWLAWQDPPGRQLHDAVKQKILCRNTAAAGPFVAWFRRLFLD